MVSGAAEDMAHSSLRFGIGRFTTEAEIDFVVKQIVATVHKLREMRRVLCCVLIILPNSVLIARYGRWFKRELTSTRSTGPSINEQYLLYYLPAPYFTLHIPLEEKTTLVHFVLSCCCRSVQAVSISIYSPWKQSVFLIVRHQAHRPYFKLRSESGWSGLTVNLIIFSTYHHPQNVWSSSLPWK
jgi:hypothetical protein